MGRHEEGIVNPFWKFARKTSYNGVAFISIEVGKVELNWQIFTPDLLLLGYHQSAYHFANSTVAMPRPIFRLNLCHPQATSRFCFRVCIHGGDLLDVDSLFDR